MDVFPFVRVDRRLDLLGVSKNIRSVLMDYMTEVLFPKPNL